MTHGTATGYAKHGCRCPECTGAQRARMREYRNRRTNKVPSEAGATNTGTTEKRPRTAPTAGGMAHKETPS